jgi:hypothetical protein
MMQQSETRSLDSRIPGGLGGQAWCRVLRRVVSCARAVKIKVELLASRKSHFCANKTPDGPFERLASTKPLLPRPRPIRSPACRHRLAPQSDVARSRLSSNATCVFCSLILVYSSTVTNILVAPVKHAWWLHPLTSHAAPEEDGQTPSLHEIVLRTLCQPCSAPYIGLSREAPPHGQQTHLHSNHRPKAK